MRFATQLSMYETLKLRPIQSELPRKLIDANHLGVIEEAPLHAVALRQVRDGALQHPRVAGADRQVGQVEADALEVQVLLPPASQTPVSWPPL